MAQDFENMLSTIGQKFDMSFEQSQDFHQERKEESIKKVNPQDSSSIKQNIEGNQLLNQLEETRQSQTFASEQFIQDSKTSKQTSNLNNKNLILASYAQSTAYMVRDNLGSENQDISPQFEKMNEFGNEGEELAYYRSLSEKFQLAISKSKSKRSLGSTCEEFIERQQYFLKQKQNQLDYLRTEKEYKEIQKLRQKPLINSYSEQLLQNHKPIEKRYPAVLAERKRKNQAKLEEQRRKRIEDEELEIQMMEQYANNVKDKLGKTRSEQEFFRQQLKWSERRDKYVQGLIIAKKDKELSDVTFKPEINSKSQKIVMKKSDRVPIYEKEPEFKKELVDPNCTFRPNLTKTLKK